MDDKCASFEESAKPGSREHLSTPRGNLQPPADSFMGKNSSDKRQSLPLNTHRVNLEACEQEIAFFPLVASMQPRIKIWAL